MIQVTITVQAWLHNVSGLSTEMTAKRNLNLPSGWVYSAESELQINILLWVLGYSQPVNTNPSSWKEKKKHTHTHKIEQDYLHDQYPVNNFIHIYLYLSFGIRQLSDISPTMYDSTVLVRHINKLKLKQREQNRLKMTTFIHNECWFV